MGRSNPFDDVETLLERLNREFDEFSEGGAAGRRAVDVDVAELDGEFVVVADLPGYDRDDIDVSLADRRLTISAERTDARDASNARFLRQERTRDSVSRTVTLPEPVVEGDASATYDDGVLTVTLPTVTASGDEGTTVDVE